MRTTRNSSATSQALDMMAQSTRDTLPEDAMKKNDKAHKQNPGYASQLTMAVRDGLITLAGIGVAAGSILNDELTMWWVGA